MAKTYETSSYLGSVKIGADDLTINVPSGVKYGKIWVVVMSEDELQKQHLLRKNLKFFQTLEVKNYLNVYRYDCGIPEIIAVKLEKGNYALFHHKKLKSKQGNLYFVKI